MKKTEIAVSSKAVKPVKRNVKTVAKQAVTKGKTTIAKVNPAKQAKQAKQDKKKVVVGKVRIPVALSKKFQQLIANGICTQVDIAKNVKDASGKPVSTASVTRWVYMRRGNIPLDGTVLSNATGKPRFPHAMTPTYVNLVKYCEKLCKENKIAMPKGITA